MPVTGEYEPSPSQWVRDQVAEYEESGGERANTLRDTGLAIVIFSTRGNRSGKVRKTRSCALSTTVSTPWSLPRAARRAPRVVLQPARTPR